VEDLDELLRALAHPARRAILRRCAAEWVAVGDLVVELELAPATVSEHLRVLRKTELVDMQINGTWRLYRTRPTIIRAVLHTLKSELP
jgi:DNA-binding transcriptional ArsR family regulator